MNTLADNRAFDTRHLYCLMSGVPIVETNGKRTLANSNMFPGGINGRIKQPSANRIVHKPYGCVFQVRANGRATRILADLNTPHGTPFWHDQGIILDYLRNYPDHLNPSTAGNFFPLLQTKPEAIGTDKYLLHVKGRPLHFSLTIYPEEDFNMVLEAISGVRLIIPETEDP